jgi:hypothetical protein
LDADFPIDNSAIERKSDRATAKPSDRDRIKPENFPERVVWYSLTWTYGFYLLGATYLVGSLIGWILFVYLLLKLWIQTEDTPVEERIVIPWMTWVWVIGMVMMEVALVIGHLDFNLPIGQVIKSSVGWAKGWALIALYPLVGCLNIRPQIIYRAICTICLHTLLISPLLIAAPILHLPQILYVSPLKVVGAGLGPTFFDVSLYALDFDGQIRQRLFTPWGPALGFVANVYFTLSLQEKNKKWRWYGIIGSIYMSQICKSRLAQVCIISTPIFILIFSKLARPVTLMFLGGISVVSGIFAIDLLNALDNFQRKFSEARAASSRVRSVLKEIAFYRAKTEAPIWGHGIVEIGPHVAEEMPIGSHHTWAGLAFVKGMVGFYSLAIPMILSFLFLLIKSQKHEIAGTGLAILFILFLYTFGENLEILAYLFWPGLVVMGIAFKSQR